MPSPRKPSRSAKSGKPAPAKSAPAKSGKPAKAAPAKPAKAYHHGDLRRALLDAGLALIEEEGAQAFTLREAARRAGVSQAAPYRHFVDKRALLGAIAEEGFRALTARMLAERAQSNAPRGNVEPLGMGYLLFALENPAHYRVMFGPGSRMLEVAPSVNEAGVDSFGVLLDGVSEGQRAGLLRAGDPMELALFAWAIVHGLALLVIDGIVPVGDAVAGVDPQNQEKQTANVDPLAFRRLAARMLQLSLAGMST
jgi:AcrR family transcriptional regulator